MNTMLRVRDALTAEREYQLFRRNLLNAVIADTQLAAVNRCISRLGVTTTEKRILWGVPEEATA